MAAKTQRELLLTSPSTARCGSAFRLTGKGLDEQVFAGSREGVHGRTAQGGPDASGWLDRTQYKAMPSRSDHFDGRRFFNPAGVTAPSFASVPRMLLERGTPWPPRVDVPPRQPLPLGGADAVLTFVGHATFLIQTAAGNILTDPMYSQRAGPFNITGPRRVRQPAVRLEDLPLISTVLLSHNHYDHCDLRTLGMLSERHYPTVITPLGNGALVRSAGIRDVEELDWWQESSNPACQSL